MIGAAAAVYAGQSDFAKTILYRIERDLSPQGNFNPDHFEFGVNGFREAVRWRIFSRSNRI